MTKVMMGNTKIIWVWRELVREEEKLDGLSDFLSLFFVTAFSELPLGLATLIKDKINCVTPANKGKKYQGDGSVMLIPKNMTLSESVAG